MYLTITTEFKNKDTKEMLKIWITCPICKHKDWYYTLWIERCDSCGFIMSSVRDIQENINTRLNFHIEGPKKTILCA